MSIDASPNYKAQNDMQAEYVSTNDQTNTQTSSPNRDLIKTATLKVESPKLLETKASIQHAMNVHQGYLFSESSSFQDDFQVVHLGIKVPNAEFEVCLDRIQKEVPSTKSIDVKTEDVTAQLVDFSARIKSKRLMEQRLYQLIEKTDEMKDVLSLEASLNQVREEIERMEASIVRLQNDVAYSTINISITSPAVKPVVEEPTFFDQAGSNFLVGWSGITRTLLGFIRQWPLTLIMCAMVFFLVRAVRRSGILRELGMAKPK